MQPSDNYIRFIKAVSILFFLAGIAVVFLAGQTNSLIALLEYLTGLIQIVVGIIMILTFFSKQESSDGTMQPVNTHRIGISIDLVSLVSGLFLIFFLKPIDNHFLIAVLRWLIGVPTGLLGVGFLLSTRL